jgi:5-methyltetrahydropteroyltriglutamate--homocysteine methyltransferase
LEVVRRQQTFGIDVPGDGEFGKSMGHRVNYRAWWSYSFNRLSGLDLGGPGLYDAPPKRARPGEIVLTSPADRRDRTEFPEVYGDPDGSVYTGPRAAHWPSKRRSRPTSPISRQRSRLAGLRKAS